MPRWKIWEKKTLNDQPPASEEAPVPPVAPNARGFHPPPPRVQVGGANDSDDEATTRLLRRREAVVFDVEQAELANRDDNPWRQRMALIDEAMTTVEGDLRDVATMPAKPGLPLPPIPIRDLLVTSEPPISVRFTIGDERFHYMELIDWAERGTQIAQPELVLQEGDPAGLVPATFPEDQNAQLIEHLAASLFVLAVELRNRALNGQVMPAALTLDQLAKPCSACGGWQDIHGTCAECQRRLWRKQQLEAELERLRIDRGREEEDRAKLADRLPIARRRLVEVDAQIAARRG